MITVYSQTGCAPCSMVERYLQTFKKEYVVKDRNEYADEMLELAGTITTPVVTDGKRVVIGYQPMELSKLS